MSCSEQFIKVYIRRILNVCSFQIMFYLKCDYCGKLYTVSSTDDIKYNPHHNGCEKSLPEFDETDIESVKLHIKCYSCGSNDYDQFTKSQLKKIGKARCKSCITANKTERYILYPYNERYRLMSLNHKLMNAIAQHNFEQVKKLLNDGANPNYIEQKCIIDSYIFKYTWLSDGEEEPDMDDEQPTTPLKLILFRICDLQLNNDDRKEFNKITKLLINAGARIDVAKDYISKLYSTRHFADTEFDKILTTILTA